MNTGVLTIDHREEATEMTTQDPSRRHRRVGLVAVVALFAAPLMTSSSAEAAVCDPTDPCVIITYVSTKNGATKTVAGPYTYTIKDSPDLVAKPVAYTVRTRRGGSVKEVKPGGVTNTLPLPSVVARASSEESNSVADRITFSETPNPTKMPAVLSDDQLDGTDPYADGLIPAVYATSDGGVGYLRPLESSKNDVNAPEVFETKPGEPLKLTFHVTGKLLAAKIGIPAKITTSSPASFSSTISPKSNEKLSYAWNFIGGTKVQARTASPKYQYTKDDTYNVNLSVRGDDGSYGRAATTAVTVGKAAKPSTGGGGGTGGGSGGGNVFSGTNPNQPTNDNSPYIPGEQGGASDSPFNSSDSPGSKDSPRADGLVDVEGYVLVGAGAEQGDSIPGTQQTTQTTQADELSTSRKISGAVIGILAVLLLLGLGVEIETRWVGTRLAHLRRRT